MIRGLQTIFAVNSWRLCGCWMLVAVLVLAFPTGGGAQDAATFTIGNYPVEARDENAVAAKTKAMQQGRRDAFRSLLKRLVPVTAYGRIAQLKDVDPSGLIDGVAVRSERNSATDYIASLDFSFRADEVRDLLRRNGVPFVDEQAPTTVVVPVVRRGDSQPMRSNQRWNAGWRDLDLKNALSPVDIQNLKPVIHVDTITMALSGDGSAERILETEYNSKQVVLVIADVDTAAGKIQVSVIGRDAAGHIHWTRSYRLVDGNVAYTLELVGVVTLGVLEGRWKAVKAQYAGGVAALGATPANVVVQASFAGLQEWNDIRRQLLQTPGVESVRIGAVSARGADLELTYPGGGSPLASALSGQGLLLRPSGNIWLLQSRY